MTSKPLPDGITLTSERDAPDLAIGSWSDHITASDPLWFMDRTDEEGRRRVKRRIAIQAGAKGDSGAQNAK